MYESEKRHDPGGIKQVLSAAAAHGSSYGITNEFSHEFPLDL